MHVAGDSEAFKSVGASTVAGLDADGKPHRQTWRRALRRSAEPSRQEFETFQRNYRACIRATSADGLIEIILTAQYFARRTFLLTDPAAPV